MTTQTHCCPDLLVDLNALADGELEAQAVSGIVAHTDGCEGCSDYLDWLRRLSAMHRQSAKHGRSDAHSEADLPLASEADESTAAAIDPGALLGRVLGRAADDEWASLARVFYELGKAYVLEANKRLPGNSRREVRVERDPTDIRRGEAKVRRHLARYDELSGSGAESPRGALFRSRSRRLLGPAAAAPSMIKGRRFLEEALALDPDLDEARIYLGFQLLISGRPDRARVEFRRVVNQGGDPVLKLMATQWLGNLHVNTGRFGEAVRCYEQVVASERAPSEPKLFSAFVNLPVTCAHMGRPDEAITHFNTLVQTFPDRITQIRKHLAGMEAFRLLLADDKALGSELRDRVPLLFAAA